VSHLSKLHCVLYLQEHYISGYNAYSAVTIQFEIKSGISRKFSVFRELQYDQSSGIKRTKKTELSNSSEY
jgi:hypothetical protein